MSELFETQKSGPGPVTVMTLKPTDDPIAADEEDRATLHGIRSPRPAAAA